MMDFLAESYSNVLAKIKAASEKMPDHKPVTLIAVSKMHSVDAIEYLYQLGQRDFGENYVQELLEKAQILENRGCSGISWHFMGHLQSNKVKPLMPYVSCIHSIDSVALAMQIEVQWKNHHRDLAFSKPLSAFLQVNVDGEGSKYGFVPEAIVRSAEAIGQASSFSVLGLMCIPQPGENSASAFLRLRELEELTRPWTRGFLSMGMSNDFQAAIQLGATHVRVGSALFGARPEKAKGHF
jgi:pyridoxal phosphate enzyme (YggS family)